MSTPRAVLDKDTIREMEAIGQRHRSQSDKFKDLAREVEADEDEAVFDRALAAMRIGKPGGAVETGGGGKQDANSRAR